jgi:predicted acetyltransferase
MPELALPTTAVEASYRAAAIEACADGPVRPYDEPISDFAEYVTWLRDAARQESPRPPGWVPRTELWYVDGEDYIGRIVVRHRLTPALLSAGGHIGYDVRPSARRRGHATAMLVAVLPHAAALGIDRALITCDRDNVASRKVIEAAGGVLEDIRGAKRRYWIRTTPARWQVRSRL